MVGEMSRVKNLLSPVIVSAALCLGVARCGSDPNLEGAKLDLRNKDYDRALENISKALERSPNDSGAHFLKGEIVQELVVETTDAHERAAYVREMSIAYRRSAELDPALMPEVDRKMVDAYRIEVTEGFEAYAAAQSATEALKQNAFSKSARLFHNASVIMPDSVRPYLNEASAYYGAGMFAEAAGMFEAAIAMGQTKRELFVHLAAVLNIMAEQSSSRTEQNQLYRRAIKVVEAGLGHHAEDAELRDMLLNYYALGGELEQAIEIFNLYYDDLRGDPRHLYNYGTLLLRLGHFDDAIEHLGQSVDLDPAYIRGRLNLGAALISFGEHLTDESHALRDSLEMLPGSASDNTVRRLENRLRGLDVQRSDAFSQAISHLEVARTLSLDASEEAGDICRALVRAYGHTNQRAKAEEIRADCT